MNNSYRKCRWIYGGTNYSRGNKFSSVFRGSKHPRVFSNCYWFSADFMNKLWSKSDLFPILLAQHSFVKLFYLVCSMNLDDYRKNSIWTRQKFSIRQFFLSHDKLLSFESFEKCQIKYSIRSSSEIWFSAAFMKYSLLPPQWAKIFIHIIKREGKKLLKHRLLFIHENHFRGMKWIFLLLLRFWTAFWGS